MGFEKLIKIIIVKILLLLFCNHFVKIVGCVIKRYTNIVQDRFVMDAKRFSNEEAVRAV